MGLMVNFPCNCYHGLNPIACQFIVNNLYLHFIMYFTHTGQSPDRQQPIKESSLNYFPFLFSWLMYPNLFKITVYLWLRSTGNTTEFQFAFCHKIRWNSIFWTTNCRWIILIFSLLEEQQLVWSLLQLLFGVFMQHALFQTGNRGCCVMGPNYGCEGDNSKCGTDAFYFCWEVFGQ